MRYLADALREEEPDLRVTTVYPRGTDTPLLRKLREQAGATYDPSHFLTPDAVADVVVDALLTRRELKDVHL